MKMQFASFSKDKMGKIKMNKNGQMKTQQMAFVLVAIVVFFAIAGLIYFSIGFGGLKESAADLSAQEAKELVQKISGSAEFSVAGCSNCVDFDKLMTLKGRKSYEGFWNLGYLAVKVTYPENQEVECTKANYPNCNKITIIDSQEIGNAQGAFVSVCKIDNKNGAYEKCEIGKIYASAEQIGG